MLCMQKKSPEELLFSFVIAQAHDYAARKYKLICISLALVVIASRETAKQSRTGLFQFQSWNKMLMFVLGRFPHCPCGSGYILGAVAFASLVARFLKRSPATQVSAPRGHYP